MEHLVAGCKQGHRKAQEALYKQLSAKMMGVCMRYAANRTDAEDILQMGFIKMFQLNYSRLYGTRRRAQR